MWCHHGQSQEKTAEKNRQTQAQEAAQVLAAQEQEVSFRCTFSAKRKVSSDIQRCGEAYFALLEASVCGWNGGDFISDPVNGRFNFLKMRK